MCLSEVYLLHEDRDKELLCKNVAAVSTKGDTLRFTNILGITTEISGVIDTVDLMDNYIYVRAGE